LNGEFATEWIDGSSYPEGYSIQNSGGRAFGSAGCIITPNLHTQNESMAAGTAFAISYVSDLSQVTEENLAVFTVAYHTPWKRVTTYQVPADMPACPEDGCICAWGWVPNGCGEPNMYMTGWKCKVTGATSTTPVAAAQPPVWCEDDQSKCVKGSKQMIYWNQQDGNNMEVTGYDLSGAQRSPAYNTKLGFADGAQNDIFGGSGSGSGTPASSSSSSAKPSSSVVPSSTPVSSSVTPPSGQGRGSVASSSVISNSLVSSSVFHSSASPSASSVHSSFVSSSVHSSVVSSSIIPSVSSSIASPVGSSSTVPSSTPPTCKSGKRKRRNAVRSHRRRGRQSSH